LYLAFVTVTVIVAALVSLWTSYQAQRCGIALAVNEWRTNPALVACASRGELRAQAYLGMLYVTAPSWGDDLEALLGPAPAGGYQAAGRRLLQVAAARGSPEAQNEIGLAYLEGDFGISADDHQALRWFRLADRGGDRVATYNLARMYYAGRGVARSAGAAKAALWKSARRGYVPAFCTLGLLYRREGDWLLDEVLWGIASALGDACSHDLSELTPEFRDPFQEG
jgi:TPR repeat protein